MNAQALSNFFSWAAVILPLSLALAAAWMKAPKLAIVGPVIVAIIAGLGLHYRNVVSAEKDNAMDQLRPRHVPDDQAQRLMSALGNRRGNIGFNTVMFDAESRQYAEQLSRVFQKAGWNVAYVAGNLTRSVGASPVIAVKQFEQLEDAKAVCAAFIAAGVGCQGEFNDDKFPESTLAVMIGQKK